MSNALPNAGPPAFYTVREAAEILRCNKNTLYRAIHEGAFPAVQVRTRYVVPAAVLDKLIAAAAQIGGRVDPARMVAERRIAREIQQATGGTPW